MLDLYGHISHQLLLLELLTLLNDLSVRAQLYTTNVVVHWHH